MYMNLAFSASLRSVRNQQSMEARLHLVNLLVVLLEVDDHLMGGPGKAHHESTERLRQRIKFGKWHRLLQDRAVFLRRTPLHTVTRDRSFKVDMTRFYPRKTTTNFITTGTMFGQSVRGRSESAASRGRFSILDCTAMST